MTLRLNDDELDKFLASPKRSIGPFKYVTKSNRAYDSAIIIIECDEFPEINLKLISTYQRSRIPRKITLQLMANNKTILRLDVHPGGIHTNPKSGETFFGTTHWHFYPDLREAEGDERELTHRQWVYEFCKKANLEIKGGYTPPKFTAPEPQFTLLGGVT